MNEEPTTGDQLADSQVIAAGLVKHCRAIIAGGANPAAVMDATLIVAAHVIADHLDPAQAPELAAWLRSWAQKLEAGPDADRPRAH